MDTTIKCKIEDCDSNYRMCRGWCNKHYTRWYKHGDPTIVLPNTPPPPRQPNTTGCSIPGCPKKHASRGWCNKHYQSFRTYGNPLKSKTYNRGNGWIGDDGYKVISVNGKAIRENRHVMQEFLGRTLEPWETVHHIDGNKLNNDISNLQLRSGQHGQGVLHQCLDCGSNNIKSVEL